MLGYLCEEWNIDNKLYDLAQKVQSEIVEQESNLRSLAGLNQARVLKAFQNEMVGEADFYPTTGYGFNDTGRDKLERVWAQVFNSESALVRQQIVSGTHALALCLFGVLRPGDELLSATGTPYDTLKTVIGIKQKIPGSLTELGVNYNEVPLTSLGEPDYIALEKAIGEKTRVVLIQRSRGYSWRPSLSILQVEKIINIVKSVNPAVVCLVDNCYGEFTAIKEPSAVGADLVAGSLIKNPGGGLAPCGGYIAGRDNLVELASIRLTAPGLARESGAALDTKRLFYQGLFIAPHVVAEALAGGTFAARMLELCGFSVSPRGLEQRIDLIQAIRFRSAKQLQAFCQGIQKAAPVDSMATLVPADMPGYNHEVIMACGSFNQGASIELSADAPLREPYTAYLQGGLTAVHVQMAILITLQHMANYGEFLL